jgi:hypothetical protein
LQVAVVLNQLESSQQRQLSLFDPPKTSKLMSTLDRINEKYGKTSLYLGPMDPGKKPMTPRIAFHAVPKVSEFD